MSEPVAYISRPDGKWLDYVPPTPDAVPLYRDGECPTSERLRAEVERLREVLIRDDICGLLRDIAAFARQGDLGEFERVVCSAAWIEGLAGEIDAALAERGGEG